MDKNFQISKLAREVYKDVAPPAARDIGNVIKPPILPFEVINLEARQDRRRDAQLS